MALSVRRPSDWSVVLRTKSGQVIRFDRSNTRLQSDRIQSRRSISQEGPQICTQCGQLLPTSAQAQTAEERAQQDPHGAVGTSAFVDPQYFRLLASCLEEEEVLENLDGTDDDDHLRHESFNQGYCARFFAEEELLGRGGKAEVVKVRHVLEGIELGVFALKRVAVGDSQAWLIKTLREVQSIRFRHANLVSYNHVWLERRQQKYGPTVPVLHILQEYCNGGDLETFVYKACGKVELTVEQMKARSRRRSRGSESPPRLSNLSNDMIFSFFKDILAGLAFLHEQGLIHRDMKASNCLIDNQMLSSSGMPRVLVSDFGEAQFINASDQRSGCTGTLAYTAPEIVRGGPWSTAADMFSLGMILYFLTHAGSLPYQSSDDDYDGLRLEISKFAGYSQTARMSPDQEDQREIEYVLSELLNTDPSKRPSCAELQKRLTLYGQHGSQYSRPDTPLRQITSTSNQENLDARLLEVERKNDQLSVPKDTQQLILPSIPFGLEADNSSTRWLASLRVLHDRDIVQGRSEILIVLILLIRLRTAELITNNAFRSSSLLCLILGISVFETWLHIPFSVRLVSSILFLILSFWWNSMSCSIDS